MSAIRRAERFCARFGLSTPILMAPMAGACPPALAAAVIGAGGMGGCGVLTSPPQAILDWAAATRALADGPFLLNNWIPDPAPTRDPANEARLRSFLAAWGPTPSAEAGDVRMLDFEDQWRAMLEAKPAAVSSIMGLFSPAHAAEARRRSTPWFATVVSVADARAAEAAGAAAIIVQGAEAGGHRGSFDQDADERRAASLFALLPAVVDAVSVPVAAAGGIADGRGVAAALALGASAAVIGTGLLRSPEAGLDAAWAAGLAGADPTDTIVTRALSGRAARSLATRYVLAAAAPDAPRPAPWPVQAGLTSAMRAVSAGDIDRLRAWAGQSAGMASAEPAGEIVRTAWETAQELLA